MPLNVVSNYAANVAHRNLQMNDTAASNSLGKLSTGKRVVNARDDAASMAIGQRLNAEVQGLKQAVVNSGQANSMLQIADGAMSTASDILTRMKVLAIQSSSGNLSSTERDFLDTEYQALFNEIDRIADDTDFAGTKLLDGSIDITAATGFAVADGVASITAQGIDAGTATSGAQYSISFDYDSAANTAAFSITTAEGSYSGSINTEALGTDGALTRATTVTVEGSGTAPAPGSFTIALNTAFDSNTDISAATQAFSRLIQPVAHLQTRHWHRVRGLFDLLRRGDQHHLVGSEWHVDRHRINGECGTRSDQYGDRQSERVALGRWRRAEQAGFRLVQPQYLRGKRRGRQKHSGRPRYRPGDDQVLQQAGSHAGWRGDVGSGQPDAAKPPETPELVGRIGEGRGPSSPAESEH